MIRLFLHLPILSQENSQWFAATVCGYFRFGEIQLRQGEAFILEGFNVYGVGKASYKRS